MAFLAFETDLSAHHLGELLGDGQPQAGAAVAAGGGGVHLGELLEQRRLLVRCDADGTNEIELYTVPDERNISGVRYSPTGNKIAVLAMGSWAYNTEIYLINPDGSNPTVLVPNDPGAMHLAGFIPDGTKLSYMYDKSGHEEASGQHLDTHLFLIGIDGTGKTDLSSGKPANTLDYSSNFSADGKKVYFMNGSNVPGSNYDIYTMNVDGTKRTLLIQNAQDPICK